MYLISTYLAKLIKFISNLLKIGSGNTWSGHFVLMINPNIWVDLSKHLPEKIVFITGTNGKTTTSKLVTHILERQGQHVLNNSSGANILNGILSCLLLGTDFKGRLNYDALVLEIDEFTLAKVMQYIQPDVLALLNLSRDQLDRHWETDIVMDRWLEVIKGQDLKLIVDAVQPEFKQFENAETFDSDVSVLKGTSISGEFNAKNINCALGIVNNFGISRDTALNYIKTFKFAFGRGETLTYKNKSYKVLLAKNPASLNQNLTMLGDIRATYDTILFVLNDNVPDGHDVSWIYDIDPTLLYAAGNGKTIFVAGTRAYDMAIRLEYSGLTVVVSDSLKGAYEKITTSTSSQKIVVMPNYSAMLESRKILVGRSIL